MNNIEQSNRQGKDGDDTPSVQDKLIQNIRVAKQALDESEQILAQINKLDKKCVEEHLKKYFPLQKRFNVAYEEIQKQLGVIKRLVLSLRSKNSNLLDAIENTRKNQESTINSLRDILNLLKEKKLNHHLVLLSTQIQPENLDFSGISQKRRSIPTEKKTLYDFVNIDSVNSIQQQAENELNEMKNIESLGKTILKSVDEQYDDIMKGSEKLMNDMRDVNTNNPVQDLTEPKELNIKEIREAGTIVLEVAGHYDRIQHILNNPNLMSSVDIKDIEEKTKTLPALVERIKELYKNVYAKCKRVEDNYKKFQEYYNSALRVYSELEKMSPLIPDKLLQIDELQSVFHQRVASCQLMFEEIADLSKWYMLFYMSYDRMLLEVYRRQKEYERQQKIIEEMNKTLNSMYIEECQKRQRFYEEFGRYLPATLYPPIMEPAIKYTLTPSHQKSPQTFTISDEEAQEIAKLCEQQQRNLSQSFTEYPPSPIQIEEKSTSLQTEEDSKKKVDTE